jgi:TolA-binding protein
MPVAGIDDAIGAGGIALIMFSVPIIAILTSHQRKMAEIMRRGQPQTQVDPLIQQQLASMQAQISDMRSMMQEHIINNDRTPVVNSVEQRLNS